MTLLRTAGRGGRVIRIFGGNKLTLPRYLVLPGNYRELPATTEQF